MFLFVASGNTNDHFEEYRWPVVGGVFVASGRVFSWPAVVFNVARGIFEDGHPYLTVVIRIFQVATCILFVLLFGRGCFSSVPGFKVMASKKSTWKNYDIQNSPTTTKIPTATKTFTNGHQKLYQRPPKNLPTSSKKRKNTNDLKKTPTT